MTLRFLPEWSTNGAAPGCLLPEQGSYIIRTLDMNNAR